MADRNALITGGTRGIGLGVAQALAREGWNLALNGVRPPDQVAEVLQSLRAYGIRVAYCQGDIASEAGRQNILAQARGAFPQLHLLVNNAGVAPKTRLDLLETTEESYDYVLDTNLKGTFFLTQAVSRQMVADREKEAAGQRVFRAIITVSSISATVASINRGEYCLAKAGLAMLNSLFASRLSAHDISVFEVRPGVIQTDMTAGVTAKYDKLIEGGLCLQKRWGQPDDIGKAVAALARGDFPYSSGQVFLVDGGLTIPRL